MKKSSTSAKLRKRSIIGKENLQQNAMESKKNPCCFSGRIRWCWRYWPGWPQAKRASLERSRDVPRKPFRTTYLLKKRKIR